MSSRPLIAKIYAFTRLISTSFNYFRFIKMGSIVSSFSQEMASVIKQHQGYVLKFVGDCVIGYFPADLAITSIKHPALCGVPGPGESTINTGASQDSICDMIKSADNVLR